MNRHRGARPASPACSSASRLWQAVTPEPHMAIDRGRRQRAEQRVEPSPQLLRGQESSVRAEIAGKGMISRAGHVARDRVDRLVAPREALRAARVDQQIARAQAQLVDRRAADRRHRASSDTASCARLRRAHGRFRAASRPRATPRCRRRAPRRCVRPIQRASHQNRAAYAAVALVVGDHLTVRVRRRAAPRRRANVVGIGQRVTPASSAVIGLRQVAIEMQILRARQMRRARIRSRPSCAFARSKRQSNTTRSSRASCARVCSRRLMW